MASIKEFDHLKIQLKDIKSATNNFGPENYIGGGGFGKVYGGDIHIDICASIEAIQE